MEIQFLGISGHGVTPTRGLPAILLDRMILLDCGEGTTKALLLRKIPIRTIRAIFLTHLHADHWIGLISLLWQQAYYSIRKIPTRQRYSIPIFGPPGTVQSITAVLQQTFSEFQTVRYNVRLYDLEIAKADLFHLRNYNIPFEYSVRWHPTRHQPMCFAYRFDDLLGYTGDTAPSADLNSFFHGCDVLIHEASFWDRDSETAHLVNHSTPLDAGKCALEAKISTLYLTHLPKISSRNEKSFLKNARDVFPNIYLATQRTRVSIPSKTEVSPNRYSV